jgi:hypothetical protein
MSTYTPTDRTTFHRIPARGTYDRSLVHAILDEALTCHVGFVVDEQPYVIPTLFVRDGETVFLHGAAASRMLKTLGEGVRISLTVTLVDGLVLARSAFHHSMNYRSVVALGPARLVGDPVEKLRALERLVDKLGPGRWASARAPNEKELRATSVLALPLDEVSAKTRSGPPLDEPEDMNVPVWAGVVPLSLMAGQPEPDAACLSDEPPTVPAFLRRPF